MHCVLVCGDASQLQKALLLCSEAQRRAGARGQLLAEGLGWDCPQLPSGQAPISRGNGALLEAGGLGQERECGESMRPEAAHQALREQAR